MLIFFFFLILQPLKLLKTLEAKIVVKKKRLLLVCKKKKRKEIVFPLLRVGGRSQSDLHGWRFFFTGGRGMDFKFVRIVGH